MSIVDLLFLIVVTFALATAGAELLQQIKCTCPHAMHYRTDCPVHGWGDSLNQSPSR